MAAATEPRKRKARARSTEIVIGCIEERLGCIVVDDQNEAHVNRLNELLDELRRSLPSNGKEEDPEA